METVLKKESEILDEFLKNESPESITDGQWHHIKLAMVAYHEQFSPVPAPSISAKEKQTGVELIAAERQEQLEKHHRSLEDDKRFNGDGQLRHGAIKLISNAIERENGCPKGWNQEIYNKMANKSLIDRLIISGALIAAEIDRIKSL